MTEEQFQKEKLYQATMNIAKTLWNQGIISMKEYQEIDTIFTKKYEPSLGILFFNIDLISLETQSNIEP